MKRFPVFLAAIGVVATVDSARGQIIISEVMFNPRGSEQANEFVELYNLSATDSVSLAGWKIGERSALDEIIAHTRGLVLAPRSFAVILDPTYLQSSTQYDSLIPPEALIVTIDDNTLGNGGLSNSTAETVILINADGDTLARYTYSLGNGDGISEEKIALNEDDSPLNWANALRVDGTPGFMNSVSRAQIDGAFMAHSLALTPYPLREGTPAVISVLVGNVGRETLSSLAIDFDLIPRGREFGEPLYLGNLTSTQAMASDDTLRLSFKAPALQPGKYILLATLTISNDANARNDTTSLPLAVSWRREVVVMNEIMFAPAREQPEWIEIYNPQSFSVPLSEWLLEDEGGGKGASTQTVFIPPKRYRVLTASKELPGILNLPDTAIILLNKMPSLNNGGDAIVLRDFSGAVIDSIAYEEEWGEAGKSIEKIWHERANTQRNWLPSRAHRGATPAAINSVSPREYDLEMKPPRFEPESPQFGETVRIETIVHNVGRNTLPNFAVTMRYDTLGTAHWENAPILTTMSFALEIAPEDSNVVHFLWRSPPTGKIQLMVEVTASLDAVEENNRAFSDLAVGFASRTLVLNEIMFDPPEGQPEWVEIFNPRDGPVALCGWFLEDEAGGRGVIADSVVIPARSFRVLAADAALRVQFNLPDSVVIVARNFPALNQTGETVRLRDLNGNVIDALIYESAWGESKRSLEKVWFERENERSNWQPSRAPRGATPAAFNSVSPREYDLEVSGLSYNPTKPKFGQDVRLEARIVNRGRRALASFAVFFYYDQNATQAWVPLGEVRVEQALASEDSILVALAWPQPPSGKSQIMAEVRANDDILMENNRKTTILPVGYAARSVVINEIYYDARSNEVEWFEVYNRSANAVNLSQWLWLDTEASAPLFLADSAFSLAPRQFAVISPRGEILQLERGALHLQTTKWPTLNNDEESIRLFDFNGGFQDSVRFNSDWGGEHGVSLERINPNLASQDSSNWSTCVASFGATPGRVNSVFTEVLPSVASISVAPNPFSPDDDGRDDFVVFQLNVPVTTALVHLKIYDLRGRLIRHLLNSRAIASHAEVIWNGRDEQGESVATGLYIVYLQALRAEQGVLLSLKTTVVLVHTTN